MYRLHIDVPLGTDQEIAIAAARDILNSLGYAEWFGYEPLARVSDDNDRQKRNYLDLDENGHASTKKIPLKET